MRRHHFTRIADPLSNHNAAHKTRDARVYVDHGSASEIQSTPLKYKASISLDLVKPSLRYRFGRFVGSRCNCLGGVANRVRAAPIPDHVRYREVDEGHPKRHKKHQRRKLNSFRKSSYDQRWRDAGERRLERHVGQLWNYYTIREGGRCRLRRHAHQECF